MSGGFPFRGGRLHWVVASSLKDQLLRAGLAKASADPRIERSRQHAEEAQARVDDETLVPAFDAPASGRIVERTPEAKPDDDDTDPTPKNP